MTKTHVITFIAVLFAVQITNAQAFSIGNRVQAIGGYTIRTSAAGASTGYATVSGTQGTILAGPTYAVLSGVGYYWYNVNWDSGQDGWSIEASMTLLASAPVISSITPNPLNWTSDPHTITINGSNFVSGCTVTLKDLTNGGTYPKSVTFVSSTQIKVTANFTNNTATWSAQVTAPTASNTVQFQVIAAVATPVISSISPNPLTYSSTADTITISGSNFVSGCTVTLKDLTNGGTYPKSVTFVSSTQIKVTANFTNNTATWSAQVTSPTASNTVQFQVIAAVATPVISSISPNPLTYSSTADTITISGSNFVSGCTVTLKDLTNGGTYPKSVTFVSSTQIKVTANFTNNTATWSAQVTSPTASNTVQFQVIAAGPVISSITPNPLNWTSDPHTITINGSNFVSGCTVTLKDLTNGGTYPKSVTFVSSTQIKVTANFTNNTATWSAQVTAPTASNTVQFQVNAAVTMPTINSVSPASPVGSNSPQPFTINGDHFVSGCTVTLRDLTTAEVFTNRPISSQNANQITINPNFTTAVHNWSVEVINPGSASSGQFNFSVQASSIPPSTMAEYFFSQRDDRWKNTQLGTGTDTIGKSGCSITCVAMLLKWANGASYNIDPSKLNTWLIANGGYSVDLINWGVAANYDGANGLQWVGRTDVTDDWASLDSELATGYKPIVYVKYHGGTVGHFVIVYERSGPSGVPSSYKILDPYDLSFDATKTLSFHSSASGTIYGLRRYSAVVIPSQPGPTISGIVPNPVTGSISPQTITINGANFVDGAAVKVTWTGGSKTLAASQVTFVNSTQLLMSITTLTDPDFWTATVTNPDGKASNTKQFQVVTVSPPVGTAILGLDVSHYQNERGDINWDQVRNSGRTFAFVKATGGDLAKYDDPYFTLNMSNGNNAGLIMGAYHVAYPPLANAVDEANHFLSVAGSYITTGYLHPVLDIEPDATSIGKAAISQWIRDWCYVVEQQTGVRPILYMVRYDARNNMEADLTKYPIWIATNSGDPKADPGSLGSWSSWAFQQYGTDATQSTCPGVTGYADLDSFNGTLDVFNQNYVCGGTPTDIDRDGKVNFTDYAIFAHHWKETGCNESNNWCQGTDFDHSGSVGLLDLKTLADNWLAGI